MVASGFILASLYKFVAMHKRGINDHSLMLKSLSIESIPVDTHVVLTIALRQALGMGRRRIATAVDGTVVHRFTRDCHHI